MPDYGFINCAVCDVQVKRRSGTQKYCEDCKRQKAAECSRGRSRAYYEANREKVAERERAHYEANREKVLERKRAHYDANRWELAKRSRAYREANREKLAERSRAYYEANREKVAEQKRAYREANPLLMECQERRKREREAKVGSSPAIHGTPWTPAEDATLFMYREKNFTDFEIASILGRTRKSVSNRQCCLRKNSTTTTVSTERIPA